MAFGETYHSNTLVHTLSLCHVHAEETRRGTGGRWRQWRRRGNIKKKVSVGVRIGDLLSKREEEFVLVDMA